MEVFPVEPEQEPGEHRLLHVRGGVSKKLRTIERPLIVFSTSVEVFLGFVSIQNSRGSLLHVRGGVSTMPAAKIFDTQSSPRPWRCFYNSVPDLSILIVFSTSVEVFPPRFPTASLWGRLLHVRGGVSETKYPDKPTRLSSPRPWRCFSPNGGKRSRLSVFSTSVEVFLTAALTLRPCESLLHVRGGVSETPLRRVY